MVYYVTAMKEKQGKRGALLIAIARNDGSKLAAYQLDFVPRFDGLIAANGRLYMTTRGGEVVCLSSDGETLAAAPDAVVAKRE